MDTSYEIRENYDAYQYTSYKNRMTILYALVFIGVGVWWVMEKRPTEMERITQPIILLLAATNITALAWTRWDFMERGAYQNPMLLLLMFLGAPLVFPLYIIMTYGHEAASKFVSLIALYLLIAGASFVGAYVIQNVDVLQTIWDNMRPPDPDNMYDGVK